MLANFGVTLVELLNQLLMGGGAIISQSETERCNYMLHASKVDNQVSKTIIL